MSIKVNCVNERQAKLDLKKCSKDVQDYVKALEASNERWKDVNDKALKKIREQAKIISQTLMLADSLPLHTCQYCGVMTNQNDDECYKKP